MNATSVKVPVPRQLGETETTETLKHWQTCFRNYYRRDSYYSYFLDAQWDPSVVNYALTEEGDDSIHKRTAVQMKADLISFLNLRAAYLPFSYATERFETTTTCLKPFCCI